MGENFDVMEDIARRVPLSNIRRPAWDLTLLRGLGLLNFSSTPLFLIRAVK